MNCPACNRNLASTLSVCPSCGTMVNDSVREELAMKISPLGKASKAAAYEKPILSAPASTSPTETPQKVYLPPPMPKAAAHQPTPPASITNQPASEMTAIPSQPPPAVSQRLSVATTKPHTSEIFTKQTSPTLIEFQNKNAVLPEWRLQLQNSVRRRNGNGQTETTNAVAYSQTVSVSKGANALKAEALEHSAPVQTGDEVSSGNPTLEKAMRRIEASRQKYFVEEKPAQSHLTIVQNQPKTFPHAVPNVERVLTSKKVENPPATLPTAQGLAPQEKNAASLTEVKGEKEVRAEKFDTNKLPPLHVKAKLSSSFEKRSIELTKLKTEVSETIGKQINSFDVKSVAARAIAEVTSYEESQIAEYEEADDRAPVALRFNAGLFDLIIGSFLSVILLAPFMLSSGNLFTLQGLFAFLATCSVVMFVYLTTTIGTMGRTLGMRLFSLEIIDIEENAYPTFHQAAVSSSVYLVSLAFGGIGFLTLFMNDEKRAAHDLLSGTIVVKEYE